MLTKNLFALLFVVFFVQSSFGIAKDSGAIAHISISSDSSENIHDSLTLGIVSEPLRPGVFDWITNLPGDWYHWAKQSFTIRQLPLISGLAAVTAITILTDYDSWQAFKKPYDRDKKFHDVNDVTSYLGDGKVQFGLSAAFLVGGFVFNNSRAIRTGSQIAEVILASGGVVQLLKHITGRESPFTATTPTGKWDFFPNQVQYFKHTPNHDAFPSGHIATAFATLTVIAENYPNEHWIKYIGYPVIGSIAVGLVSTSIHWWSDIPLGMVIGYSFGMLVAHPEGEVMTDQAINQLQPSLNFSVLSNGVPGIGLSLHW